MFRILVIDDDPIIQKILGKSLQEQGYEVITASDGEEGIAKAHHCHPALILCDWQMPKMDGLEVCQQIKSDPSLMQVFFILLTSRSAVVDRVKGLDTGADDFLSKPIEISELKARIRAGLRLFQASKELQTLAQELQTQKQALESALTEAAEYVKSLLPDPINQPIAINSRFLPSQQLGGDCFDYYWLDPDYLMIYLLDVSGHGLGAALPSVAVQNMLRSQSLPEVNFYQPSHVLTALNEVFQMSEQNARYFTIWYGVYNRQKRQLTYASAGHPPAILVTQEPPNDPQIKQLKTRGTPIGMVEDAKYTSASCEVNESSNLYIFSDGIYEIRQHDETFWDLNGFVNLLTNYSATKQIGDPDEILREVQTVSGRDTFDDDCSLIQIRFS